MPAARKRLYVLVLPLLLAGALPRAAAASPQAVQTAPPPAAPQAGAAAPTAEQEANRKKAQELFVEVFSNPGMDLATQDQKLTEAFKLDPANAFVMAKLSEVRQKIDEQKKQTAEKQKEVQAEAAKEKETNDHVKAANDAYIAAGTGGGTAALQRAESELNTAISMGAKGTAVYKLQSLIYANQRTNQIRNILYIVMAAGAALGGIFAALKLRPKPVSLEITDGPQAGELLPVRKKLIVIGTMESQVDWVLDDPAHRVSRRHCEITRRGRRRFLVDCSTNGTHLNGVLLQRGEPTLLRPGDEITLGGTVTIRYQ